MLWFLRKVFGVIALAWVVLLLLFWLTCVVSPKTSGTAFIVTYFLSFVGVPASIIWAALKVISVLSKHKVEQLAPVAASHPSSQVSTPSVLGLSTPTLLPQAKRIEPSRPLPLIEPEVYTYSAPGMPTCPRCEHRPIIFYCSTHQTGVCLQCVAKHDEPGKCTYVPAFRAPKATVTP
jgi:hypothetical protein